MPVKLRPRRPLRVAVLLFEGVNSIDVAGPLEAFASVLQDDRLTKGYEITTWSLGSLRVRSECGLQLAADIKAPDRPQAELLLVPGGPGVREPGTLASLGKWLSAHHRQFPRIASVCTGAYALAQSGLVDNRTVTTHWAHAVDLRRKFPNVHVTDDVLHTRDGKFYSSGGVTAGIDLALSLIEADWGQRAAMDAARELVVFLRRTGSQAQFSEPLKLQTQAHDRLGDVCVWASNNLGADLSVEELASRANLSPRQFSRRFKQTFGSSPAQYIATLRLDAARTALSTSGASVEQIAHTSGYDSVDGFRRAFERRYQLNPAEYQRRFGMREIRT
jgi:transcriptional regulator GlxA family with amidase domain